MTPWYLFPPDDSTCTAHHDTAGWTLTAVAGVHPSNGAPCQIFSIPEGTPDKNGCSLQITDSWGKTLYSFHGILILTWGTPATGAGLLIDIFPKPASVSLPRLVPQGVFLAQEE